MDFQLLASSYWPYLIIVVVAILAFLIFRQLSAPRRLPYIKRESLITKAELKFYRVLKQSVAGDWEVFAMVRIADLVRVKKGVRKYRSWLNKILAKHIDFVLCDPDSLKPVCAIELDDRSHDRPERQDRDALVNDIFSSAEFPLLRVRLKNEYDVKDIRKSIEIAINS